MPGAAYRKNGEDAPGAGTEREQVFLEFFETGEVPLVDACNHVEDEVRFMCHHPDGIRRILEGFLMAAHPGVLFPEAVEADGGGVDAAGKQAVETPAVEQDAVGDHAPGVFALVEFFPDFLQVTPHERLAAGEDDERGMGIDVRGEAVDYAQEIGSGHVLELGTDAAVAATMQARRVAAQRAFPEKLPEPVLRDPFVLEFGEEFEFRLLDGAETLAGHFFFSLILGTSTWAIPEYQGFLSLLSFLNVISTCVVSLSNSPPFAGPSLSSNWIRTFG